MAIARTILTPTSVSERWSACVRAIHRIIGAPDYDGYVEHVRRCHPECALLTRDEFARQRMDQRYSTPGTRCC